MKQYMTEEKYTSRYATVKKQGLEHGAGWVSHCPVEAYIITTGVGANPHSGFELEESCTRATKQRQVQAQPG